MRAVVQDRYGHADVLTLRDVAVPIPSAKDVIVRIRAASINALDWRLITGRPFLLRLLGFGLLRPKRPVRGVDLAGVVLSVGPSGSVFKVGDEVFGVGSGAFAEIAAAEESDLVLKPSELTFAHAATLGVAACTALQALRDHGRVRPKESVAITGAASGVGSFAVQLAKWMGARVTAVTASHNVELARSLGADEVVDYTQQDFTRSGARFDLIVDISGRNTVRSLRQALRPNGRIVVVGGRGSLGLIMKAGLARRLLRYPIRSFIAKVTADDLRLLGELVARGTVRPVIERTYRLDQVPSAMADAERYQRAGKLVIEIS